MTDSPSVGSKPGSGVDSSEQDDRRPAARSSIGRNTLHMMSSQAATWVLATVLAVAIPRMLGEDATGELRLAFSLWLMVQVVVGLGTSTHLNLSTARHPGQGLAMVGPVLLVRTIGFVVASAAFAVYLSISDASAELTLLILLSGVQLLFASWGDTLASAFFGLERMSVPAITGVISKVLGTAAAIVVLFAGGQAWTVVAVMIVANGISVAILAVAFRRIAPIRFAGWHLSIGDIVRKSLPYLATGAILTIYQQVDTVVIATIVDEATLGWYAASDALFGSLLFPASILAATVFPALGRLHVHAPHELPALVRRTFSLLLLLAVPIGLGTTVIAGPFAPLLYGADFAEAGPVLAVLGVVIVFTFCTILFGMVAVATGRQRFWTLLMLVAVILTIPLDLILVPWTATEFSNGAIGGALAYVVTELLMLVVGAWKIVPYLFTRSSVWRWARIIAAGGLMVLAAFPLRNEFLLIPIATGAVVYCSAVLAFRVMTEYERHLVGKVLARTGIHTHWAV